MGESLLLVELLLAGREDELGSAIGACQGLVLQSHFFSRGGFIEKVSE
jgi:hypothetical protein